MNPSNNGNSRHINNIQLPYKSAARIIGPDMVYHLYQNAKNVMHIKFNGMITCILLFLPYFLIISYWFLIKFRERIADWYDEKQWIDVTKAGFTTLLISIPLMIILFITTFNKLPGSIFGLLWLPLYLFSVLFIFSLCTLYYNNRAY